MTAGTERHALCCELVQDVARSTGEVRLRVIGASMLPAVWPGDVVTVQRCELAEFRPGQIVVYQQEEKLVIHRVECVSGDHLITRGDSRPRLDPPVDPGDIIGRVVSIERKGRTVDPEQAFWQRGLALVFRQSHFLRRLAVYVHRRLQRTWRLEAGETRTRRTIPLPVPAAKR